MTEPLEQNGEYRSTTVLGDGRGPESTILRRFATAVGIPFDPTRTEIALRRAQTEVPPTLTRAARVRLEQAAESLGLHILTRHLSIREALGVAGPETPLALYGLTSRGARWHLLLESRGGKGRLETLDPGDPDSFLSPEQLAQHLGASGPDAVLEWLIGQSATQFPISSTQSHAGAHDHDAGHHSHGPSPLRRLLSLLQPEWRDLGMVVIYCIAVGILSLAVPLTAMAVVNTTAMATLIQQLIVLCAALFASLGLASLLRVLQSVIVEYLQQRMFVRVVADLAYRLPRVDLKAFDRDHGPELVNRFFDVLTVQKAGATLLLDGVAIVLQVGIGLLLLAAYHQLLLGFDLILIAGLLVIIFVLGRNGVNTAISESRAKYVVAGWIEEMARHPAAFKLHGGPRFALERADLLARDYLNARQVHYGIVLRQFATALFLQALASTALLGLGGFLVIEGQLTLGQLVAAEIVVTLVVASFTKLGKQLENYYDLLAAVDKLGHLMDLPQERHDGIVHTARSQGASIKIHNVTFSYEHGHRIVLQDFHLEVAAGERVALLGPNGAGKSTLVDLLFGMRTPTRGHIAIDGIDVRELRLESFRQHTAVVKGIEIFAGTILDNVRMGREEVTKADARAALTSVGLLDEVQDFPDGLETILGTGGAPLSLGQAERLMLARAIVGQPRLLVLDETLDDMDRSVRHEVLPAILGREARWTLLVVTHSEEVARLCDREVRMPRTRGGHASHVATAGHG